MLLKIIQKNKNETKIQKIQDMIRSGYYDDLLETKEVNQLVMKYQLEFKDRIILKPIEFIRYWTDEIKIPLPNYAIKIALINNHLLLAKYLKKKKCLIMI